jgi:nicotinic acid mononucleotide adenylyltransferase
MKKTKEDYPDFFEYAKELMGEERYNKAIKKGQARANKLRLKMARELIGLNQTDLKGFTQPEVSKIEKRKDLKISTLEKYAQAIGMKVKISLVLKDDEEQEVAIYG